MLGAMASQFDVLGFIAAVLIRLKLLFQDICKLTHLKWNSVVPKEIIDRFNDYMADLKYVELIKKPRWFGFRENSETELIASADASERALCAMIYARTKLGEEYRVSLIMQKSRVSPLNKNLSLPQLEMAALEMSAQLMKKVYESLNFESNKDNTYFFSDSKVALYQLMKPNEKT